ncbi:MAG: hypothetical protein JO093_09430 [Acidobacteria bacterium]|nr:hypothetical protein [Acidobacteriota bacterium]MBV9069928.1 hypothetical protein [Acidobacteriota bacterium]MBV9185835.1 hypothetical protein [Acidobacteriota bacterium]
MKRQKTLEGNHQPSTAKYLLYLFLTHDEREVLLGDMEEDFRRAIIEFGVRRARAYYTMQAITSVAWLTLHRLERSRLARALIALLAMLLANRLGVIPLGWVREILSKFFR